MLSFLKSLFTKEEPRTELERACEESTVEEVTRQLDLQKGDFRPESLLNRAMWGNNVPVLTYLIARFKDGQPKLPWEIARGASMDAARNVEYYKLLWEANPDILTAHFGHMGNAGGLVILARCAPTLAFMLEKGLDPDSPEFNSKPAIHVAASEGYLEIVTMLLDHGANIKQTNSLAEAQDEGQLDVLKFLVEKGGMDVNMAQKKVNDSPGYDSDEDDDPDVAEAAKASPVLHLAIAKGQREVVRFLLQELNADATVTDGKGRTALQVAQKKKDKKILELLAKAQKS